jgi:hypothetical protein
LGRSAERLFALCQNNQTCAVIFIGRLFSNLPPL